MSDTEEACGADSILRKEIKQLRADIQALKKSVTKGDKKAKKEIQAKLDELEAEIANKQAALNADEGETITAVVKPEALYVEKDAGRKQERKSKRALMQAAKARAAKEARPDGPDYNAIEQEKLARVLTDAGLEIHAIDPDGHCLFAAVAHQLSLLSSDEPPMDYMAVRKVAADYMQEHGDFYVNFIDSEEVFEADSKAGIEDYCEEIRSSALWGGHLELDALAKAFQHPIKVWHAETMEPHSFGDENGDAAPMNLCFQRHAYSLGEHYDSLVPRSA